MGKKQSSHDTLIASGDVRLVFKDDGDTWWRVYLAGADSMEGSYEVGRIRIAAIREDVVDGESVLLTYFIGVWKDWLEREIKRHQLPCKSKIDVITPNDRIVLPN